MNPYNGSVYTVDSFNYTDKSVTLTSWIYEVLPLALSDSKLITNNNRIAKGSDGYNVFFDVVKYSSEYYNTYIGVDAVGQINSILVPLYSYTVDSIELNDNLNYGTLRSNDNIQVVLHLIYKTSTRNIVATIPAVSRLNTSKFSVKYNYTTANYVGEIYAFTDSENNNTLTQYDSSYYDRTYMIAILNDKFIKIKVDSDIYTYTSANNEIPLSNEILPLVVAYGDRTNSDGNTERRYLSLVDIKGNVVTYDRELKTFVDASGYVDVDVPYFSTEAVIFPSKVNNTTTIEEEVTATAE